MSDVVAVTVPLLNETLEPPPRDRVRALKRHLIQSLRGLRAARRPDRLAQKTSPPPAGFTATVMNAGCATCQGFCCKGGGDHAYIDERTMYRVRRDNPDLDAAAITGFAGAERNTLWLMLVVATANVALGVWRPRFTRSPAKRRSEPA